MLNEDSIKLHAEAMTRWVDENTFKNSANEELCWILARVKVLMAALHERGFDYRAQPAFVMEFMELVFDTEEKTIITDPYANKRDFIHETAGKTLQRPRYVQSID